MDAKLITRTLSQISIASLIIWVVLFGAIGWADSLRIDDQRFARAKAALLKAIESDVSATSNYIGTDKLNPAVMRAMGSVRRHRFVPEKYVNQAYNNHPLPIGHGQTISQPYIVALMSNLLALNPGDRVLEVGTGSGYQAAILAEMGMNVYSIEIIRPLAETARQRLKDEGYGNVHVTIGDGYFGWKQHAPFDAIIVTAATDHIPPPLLEQLRKGGKMVIPVGGQLSVQQLVLVTKRADDTLRTRQILPVRFVPLTRRP
jgi:protein-L-isoaspartate(D-aspartate) O-methyltransferase